MSVLIDQDFQNESQPALSRQEQQRMEDVIRDVIEGSLDYVSCPYECEVDVLLTDNARIREINRENRDLDVPTDVLSFPMLEYAAPGDFSFLEEESVGAFHPETGELLLGDIVISLERAREQAEEYGHSFLREVAFLTAHSMLHLFGYDHMEDAERALMERMQSEILSMKGYTRDYE